MKSFEGKVVVITGAGSGIGRAIAEEFFALGSDLVLVDIRADRLKEVRETLGGGEERVSIYPVDVGDRQAMETFARTVLERKGHVDILINNAGVGMACEVKDTSLEDWEWIMRVNYWGVVYGIRAFLPSMLERGAGHIVTTASANGLFAFPYEGVYSSTKFALVGLGEVMRAELAPHGIGVTTLCPGLVRTNILNDARLKPGTEQGRNFLDTVKNKIMVRRGAEPKTIARAIPWAVSRNLALVKVPFHVKAIHFVYRHFPWLYRWVLGAVARRTT